MPAPAIARANAQITQTRTERGAKSQGNSRTRRERTLFVADAVRDAAKMLLADLANEGARENADAFAAPFAMLLSLLKRPVLSGFGLKKGPSLSKALINSAPSPCTRTS